MPSNPEPFLHERARWVTRSSLVHPLHSIQEIVCPDCDVILDAPALEEGEKAICPRCVASLVVRERNAIHRTAALAFSAAMLFMVSNFFPFMTLRAGLRQNEMMLWQSASGLEEQGYPYLAGAVSIFILGAPVLLIGGLLYLVLPLLWERRFPGAFRVCRAVLAARRWNMLEVFLLGALVSLLKLGKLAELTLGTAFWSFGALILCLTAALASIHPRELWTRLEMARG
ncbi:MAG: paraquat-inducible protein A [Chthoniobacterales bacterium]